MSTAVQGFPGPGAIRTGYRAHFASRWLPSATAVVTAHGELDAANTAQFVDYTLHHLPLARGMVLDLGGVDFLGTDGFSALHAINVRCAAGDIDWMLVPSAAVNRVLRVCDPNQALSICGDVDTALSELQGAPRRLLQLVAKAR